MPQNTSTPHLPHSIPKLEAELIADEYAALADQKPHQTVATNGRGSPALSTTDQKRLRQRLRDLGVSEESLKTLTFQNND